MKIDRNGIPGKKHIAQHWHDLDSFNIDMDLPCCFACQGGESDTWSTSRLERAHIIAHAEGGSADVGNFVLLCFRCHAEAPMVGTSKSPMIDWINRHESNAARIAARITKEITHIPASVLSRMNDIVKGHGIEAIEEHCKKHLAGLHVRGDSTATVVAILHAVALEQERIWNQAPSDDQW